MVMVGKIGNRVNCGIFLRVFVVILMMLMVILM